MVDPAPAKRRDVQPVVFHNGICFAEIKDVIFRIVFFDGSDVGLVLQGRDGFIEVLVEFLPEDFFEFLTVIAGVGFEIFVTVENIEDLNLHVGQITGHDELFVLICYIGESFPCEDSIFPDATSRIAEGFDTLRYPGELLWKASGVRGFVSHVENTSVWGERESKLTQAPIWNTIITVYCYFVHANRVTDNTLVIHEGDANGRTIQYNHHTKKRGCRSFP